MKYLENETIRLRALEPEDIDLLYKWENDSSLWETGSTLAPYSRFALKEYIKEARLDLFTLRQLRLIIELKENNRVAGMVDLYDFDPQHRRAGVGVLVDPACRKKGVAYQSLRILEKYAFDFLHLHQLFAYVPNENTVSSKLFRKLQYQPAGVLKEWLCIEKRRIDVTVMQRIAD